MSAIAASQHGLITRAQMLEIGFGSDVTRRRLRAGRMICLHRGIYGIGGLLPPHAPMMAAVLACGRDAVLSHLSAASLFGLVSEPVAETAIDVTVPACVDRVRPGICVRRTNLDPDEITSHDGIPVTTPLRTLVDVTPHVDDYTLERAIARAEREQLISTADLTAATTRYRGRPGAARLRTLVARIGGPSLTRSEAEARFLALLRRARLPAPRANARIGDFEVDFLWPDLELAVEVDGFRFHRSRARFESDRRRTARLAALGIQVVPLTWRQIVEDELATAALLGQVLARAGRR